MYLALINTKVYYDCDCHYGRIIFAETYDTKNEAKTAIEEKLKELTVDEADFTDKYTGWKDNKLRYVCTKDYEEVKVFEDEEASTFAASIIEFNENNGEYLLIAHSCFDTPEVPTLEAQGSLLKCRIHEKLYYATEQRRTDDYRDKDEYPDVAVLPSGQVDKAYKIGYAWVKNPTGMNLVDGCEGVSLSTTVFNWKTGELKF